MENLYLIYYRYPNQRSTDSLQSLHQQYQLYPQRVNAICFFSAKCLQPGHHSLMLSQLTTPGSKAPIPNSCIEISNQLLSRPFPSLQLIYNNRIPNIPGKSIISLQVNFSPNAATPPHTHAGAFLSVNVLSGHVFNKMNDDPMKVFGPGETFTESPTCRHVISENASATEPASMVATLIIDTEVVDKNGIGGLLVIDEEYRQMVQEAQAAQQKS
jgi:quercetin dioxygenase-like cupin family protein